MSLIVTALNTNSYFTGSTGVSTSSIPSNVFNFSDRDLLSYIDNYISTTLEPATGNDSDGSGVPQTIGLTSNILNLSDRDMLSYIDDYISNTLVPAMGNMTDSPFI